jgi:hypothetical protein
MIFENLRTEHLQVYDWDRLADVGFFFKCTFYSSPNVIVLMYSRNMKFIENVARKRQVI